MTLAAPGSLTAQEVVLDGRVIGPEGEPVADAPVVLHRISTGAAGPVDRAVSGADGTFALEFSGQDDGPNGAADAAYFAAARYNDTLYLGAIFRGPEPPSGEYVIRISEQSEISSVAAAALAEGAGGSAAPTIPASAAGPTGSDGSPAALAVFLLLGVAVVGVGAWWHTRRRRRHRRSLLLELAKLEERHVGGTMDEEPYRRRRDELVARVRAAS